MIRSRQNQKMQHIAFGATACVIAGAIIGGATASARDMRPPVAALNDQRAAPTAAPADSQNLADAVERWSQENPGTGPGLPVTSEATDLMSGLGRGSDTLTAFRTDRGDVCFHIRGAGTCGRVDTPTGITFAVLSTRSGGSRVYGVAADQVKRVEVRLGDVIGDAVFRNNGFFYQLPEGLSSIDISAVTAVWRDGSAHAFPLPVRG